MKLIYDEQMQEFDERLLNVEGAIKELREGIDTRLESIENFVTGATTVFGFARKHWKTALTFGAGLMTAAGVGNPNVNTFIVGFFGG